jgi:hypothetical protein
MATLKIKDANGKWIFPEDPTAIKYTRQQSLTDEQKRVARENICAAAVGEGGGQSFSPEDSGKLVVVNEEGQLEAMEIAVSGAF